MDPDGDDPRCSVVFGTSVPSWKVSSWWRVVWSVLSLMADMLTNPISHWFHQAALIPPFKNTHSPWISLPIPRLPRSDRVRHIATQCPITVLPQSSHPLQLRIIILEQVIYSASYGPQRRDDSLSNRHPARGFPLWYAYWLYEIQGLENHTPAFQLCGHGGGVEISAAGEREGGVEVILAHSNSDGAIAWAFLPCWNANPDLAFFHPRW